MLEGIMQIEQAGSERNAVPSGDLKAVLAAWCGSGAALPPLHGLASAA